MQNNRLKLHTQNLVIKGLVANTVNHLKNAISDLRSQMDVEPWIGCYMWVWEVIDSGWGEV